MSKFGCSCGHVISDVEAPNEVTGALISDKDEHAFFELLEATALDFLEHLKANNLAAWRAKHFNEIYPTDAVPAELLADAIYSRFLDHTRAVMECDACGRLYIERVHGSNRYRGDDPELDPTGDETPHVLGPVVSAKPPPASRE